MKRIMLCVLALAATCVAGQDKVEKDKTEQPLRLTLNLTDGSRVMGQPAMESVPVQTSYAKVEIPLTQIRAVKMGEDHESASIELQNGDKVSGVVSIETVRMETIFGMVSVGIEHIKDLAVVRGGALSAALQRGLVLHYSFDRDDGFKVVDSSGRDNHGSSHDARWAEKGKAGGALEFNGSGSHVIMSEKPLFATDAGFTVSVWVYSRQDAGDGRLVSLSGSTEFTCGIGPNGGYMTYCAFRHEPAMHSLDQRLSLVSLKDQWHHFVISYDGKGKGSTSSYRLLLDGAQIPFERANICGGSSNSSIIGGDVEDGNIMFFKGQMDELMIYDRALTVEEVRQIYDFQK